MIGRCAAVALPCRPFTDHQETASMYAILRGASGRRHEVDFGDDPVTIDVAMSPTTVQVTMAAADPGDLARSRFVTVALPRAAVATAMAAAAARPMAHDEPGLRLVGKD